MAELYDCIIAGAGPAGGSAAYFLRQGGGRVLVLEKQSLPRYKACGGGVSLDFLNQHFPFSFAPVVERTARSFTYIFGGMEVPIPCQPGTVALVMRSAFDAHLLAQADVEVRQGAVLQVAEEADRVRVQTRSGEVYEGKTLIGADGANSLVAHGLGLRRRKVLIPAVEAEITPPAEVLERFSSGPVFVFHRKLHYGYAWIFPKGDHLSVGAAAQRARPGQLEAMLQHIMPPLGVAVPHAALHGHPIPVDVGLGQIATRRCLLVGDAAGLVNPFSGEGIRPAIKSGRWAAEAVLAGKTGGYQARVRATLGVEDGISAAVAHLFYNLRWLCLVMGAPNPFTTELIVELLADRGGVLSVLLGSIGTLPVYLPLQIAAETIQLLRGEKASNRFLTTVFPGTYGEAGG